MSTAMRIEKEWELDSIEKQIFKISEWYFDGKIPYRKYSNYLHIFDDKYFNLLNELGYIG